MTKKSELWRWNRYKDGMWIPYRKRTYLYWFKFLQEAERSPDYKVNWKSYRGWGGSNVVLGQRFDDWWDDRWKDLFGEKDLSKPKLKFPIEGKPKLEAIRISWLVWLHRDTPPDYTPKKAGGVKRYEYSRRGSNHIAIARKIIATEKRTQTYLLPLDPDSDNNINEDKTIASLVGRYKRRAIKITENVCEGRFP